MPTEIRLIITQPDKTALAITLQYVGQAENGGETYATNQDGVFYQAIYKRA